jgi:hypothetical protein
MFDLSEIIAHGSLLCESQAPSAAQDIAAVLVSRLHRYQGAAGQEEKDYHASSLETMQIETAQEALSVLDLTQQTMTRETAAHNAQTNLGVRDMGVLRTLLSIVFKWGVEPPYTRLADSWPGRPIEGQSSRIMDLTNCPQDFALLRDMLLRLLALVYPAGVTGSMDSSGVIMTLMSPHLNELLKPCLALGWLPKSISSSSMPVVDEIRPMVMRLITRQVMVCCRRTHMNLAQSSRSSGHPCVGCSNGLNSAPCTEDMLLAIESSDSSSGWPRWSISVHVRLAG